MRVKLVLYCVCCEKSYILGRLGSCISPLPPVTLMATSESSGPNSRIQTDGKSSWFKNVAHPRSDFKMMRIFQAQL